MPSLQNKMRSLFMMLGIIIGVGAVIAMVSIGMGVRTSVADSFASLGSNMLVLPLFPLYMGTFMGETGGQEGKNWQL